MAPPPPRTRTRGRKLPPRAGATKRAAAAAAAAAKQVNHSDAVEKDPHVLDPDNESGDAVSMEVEQETADGKTWIQTNVDQEVARIRATGTSIEPLTVKNFGVVVDLSRKKPTAINRIEINSSFDFKKVQQIMVSPGIPYPYKENFDYVNVLLLVDKAQTPMLVPYLYDTKFKTQEPVEEDPDKPSSLSTASSSPSSSTLSSTATADQRPWIHVKNNLTEWLLVNTQHMRARHHIDEFHDI
ncbi:hypothetical protein BX616_005153 [Lobosporangium transversale]|uniref:Uncharacterized protein n=1 Tax=Lobosporangium transversale TaxID=64571 RepID=A0A1Y2GSU4_9FUNG|nr:hypothetical protein BCR41DRAFT_420787 [Lobosporangium transversale]KAF9897683.1 hypothetical protein BX616_005153 [Lobosporangium transversale]ORZ21865.1 hypothetical protein BCR41DRAFT_420787 [Lobosporangium transversale]|eukprot:XP_021883116.1 hypothetical protein BCR41DRAFT_420787 [Lobosporangium transversale]